MADTQVQRRAKKEAKELKNKVDFLLANIGGGSGVAKEIKRTLTASEIKAIGTTPIELIPAPGAGKYIHIISGSAWLNWNSVAFDNNVLNILVDGALANWFTISSLVNSTADKNRLFSDDGNLSNITSENSAVMIEGTDSVATGDSTADVYCIYVIMTK